MYGLGLRGIVELRANTCRPAQSALSTRSISFAPVTKRVQDNIAAENVVPQSVISPADAPLPFSWREPGKFFYLVTARAILWICLQDCKQFLKWRDEEGISLRDFSKFPLECGGHEYAKGFSHPSASLFAIGTSALQRR